MKKRLVLIPLAIVALAGGGAFVQADHAHRAALAAARERARNAQSVREGDAQNARALAELAWGKERLARHLRPRTPAENRALWAKFHPGQPQGPDGVH